MTNFNAQASIPANIWWGQIVDDVHWKDNTIAEKWKGPQNIPGWGDRYKVCILGRDTPTKDVPDDQLEWAELIYPVTAGSGHGGSYQTSNLRKGAYVIGFYKDGVNLSEPIILGCIGNNEQTRLSQSIPTTAFTPYSAYINEQVSVNDISASASPGPASNVDNGKLEGCTSNATREICLADNTQKDDGSKTRYLMQPTDCSKLQLGRIQNEIQNLIQDIQRYQQTVNSWESSLLKPINENGKSYSVTEYINYKIQNASEIVAGGLKTIITGIQQGVTNEINKTLTKFYYGLFPNERPGFKKTVETTQDLVACLFRKIIGSLLSMASQILKGIVNSFINGPLACIETLVAGFLAQIGSFISSALGSILGPVEALIGSVFNIADGIFNFITDLLSFLSCEETPQCPEVTGWVPWSGVSTFNVEDDIDSIVAQVNNITTILEQTGSLDFSNVSLDLDINVDAEFGTTSTSITNPLFQTCDTGSIFDLDIPSIIPTECNIGATFCTPPTINFYSSQGSGATGNPVIGSNGEILSVDIVSSGSYCNVPTVTFSDNCGSGSGATGIAVTGPVEVGITTTTSTGITTTITVTTTGIVDVVITNSGFGYLPAPNGDLGGDGRVWAEAKQTTVKRSDNTYDRPYDPGETFNVNPGDEVYSCGRTTIITESQTITAPECSGDTLPRGEDPSLNNGTYPVVLELDKVFLEKGGIGYDPNKDKIKVTPDNGAILDYKVGPLGEVTEIIVVQSGIGFTEMPSIQIESETGFNMKAIPVLKPIKDLQSLQRVNQNQIISVIDCCRVCSAKSHGKN